MRFNKGVCVHSKFLLGLMLASQLAFAGTTVDEFSTANQGSSDINVRGEFSSTLSTASPDALQPGKLYLRQKFQDAFDESIYSYSLFVGVPNSEAPKMVRFDPAGLGVGTVLRSKVYRNANPVSEDADVEKIYADQNSIYVDYGDALYVKQDGNFVKLSVSSQPNALVASGVAQAAKEVVQAGQERQAAADEVTEDIDAHFGYGSEIRTYTGWGLVGLGALMVVPAVLEHQKVTDAQTAYDQTNTLINEGRLPEDDVDDPTTWYKAINGPEYAARMPAFQQQLAYNKNVLESRQTARLAWAAGSVLSVGSGILVLSF
jgi:hypothetical protein